MFAPFRKNKPLIIFTALTLLVLALTATSIYFYKKAHRLSGGAAASQAEVQALVKAVGKIMLLPEETPTIATVSDPEKLKDQEFFVDAQEGYKVLIYTTAKKAVLYDPKSKRIINVAPVNLGTNTAGTTQ